MLPFYIALLISAIGVATAPVLVRSSEVDPTVTLWLRMGVAYLLLFVPVGTKTDSSSNDSPAAEAVESPPSSRRQTWGIMLSGLLFCGDMLANHWAVKFTSVANTSLLMNLTPVFVVAIAYIMFRERQSLTSVVGVLMAVLGAAVLVGQSYSLGREQLLGDVLALSSALIYAVYMVVTKMLRNSVSAARLLKWQTGLSCLFLMPLVWNSAGPMFPSTIQGWIIIIGLATISQLIGHGLMTFAMKRVSAGISSMSTLIIPVFSVLMAWVFLGEAIHSHHLLGGLLVLGGIGFYVAHDLQTKKS